MTISSNATTNGTERTIYVPWLVRFLADIRVSIKDVRNFLKSDYIKNYNPIDDYLFQCYDKWDGKDHIRALARTVPTNNPYWANWFYTWFLGMVDQWRGFTQRTIYVPWLVRFLPTILTGQTGSTPGSWAWLTSGAALPIASMATQWLRF